MFGDKPVGISEDFGVRPLDFQNQKKTFFSIATITVIGVKTCWKTFKSQLTAQVIVLK